MIVLNNLPNVQLLNGKNTKDDDDEEFEDIDEEGEAEGELEENNEFDALKDVKATDKEDGEITKNIKVKENTVNVKTPGTYKVIYEVKDSLGKTTTKEIKVIIKKKEEVNDDEEKEEQKQEENKNKESKETINIEEYDLDELLEKQKEGEFYLDNLSWDNSTKKFTISGYLIINNINNVDKKYAIILEDKTSEETYIINIDSWKNNVPYSLGKENNNSYEESWFKGEINFKNIQNGDYNLYMVAYNDNNFTVQNINNFFNKNISRRGEDNNHGYNFKVQQRSKTKAIELSVRDELYTTSEAPTTRNMVNGYDEISFKNNKLYMYAYSYDFDGVYSSKLNITRKVIFENINTYKQEVFDVGSTEGPFELETLDKKDKKYAWYEQELDLSNLTPGKYSVQVYTKTSNAANYDELTDISKRLKKQATINNKKYTISVNKERNNRIELTVE